MAKVLITEDYLSDIGDAIREKLGGSTQYTPGQMASAISSIPTVDPTLISKSISANGTYNAEDDNADGYDSVSVNVPNSYSAQDEGKVVSSGELVAQTSRNVTQNGIYDTTENNEVVVNVSGGGGQTNPYIGTITPTSVLGVDGDTYIKVKHINGYIYSSGDSYINTGYKHKSDTKIVCECNIIQNTQRQYEAIFGARSGNSNSKSMIVFTRFGNANRICIARSGSETVGNDFPYDKDITITFENATASWESDDGDTGAVTPSSYNINDGTCPMFIFDLNKSTTVDGITPDNSRCVAYLYSFKAYESGVLVLDLEPYNNNGVWTLRDEITGNVLQVSLGTLTGASAGYKYVCRYIKENGAWVKYT